MVYVEESIIKEKRMTESKIDKEISKLNPKKNIIKN